MKATYRGPGDAIELDGLRFEKGETYDVTADQVARMRVSDPAAAVDVTGSGVETADETAQIRAKQNRLRERQAADRERAAREAAREADRMAREDEERAQKAAEKSERAAAKKEA